jgi:tetratricopeptide (TPR) repeat protein
VRCAEARRAHAARVGSAQRVLEGGAAVGLAVGSRPRSALIGVLALAVLGGLGALSRAQTRVWHDSITLWSRVVELDPSSYHGRWMLGVSLHRAGRFAEALEQYDEEARYNRALSLLALGRGDEAESALLEVLQDHPTHLPSLIALRDLCEASGRRELVLKLLVRSVNVDPGFVEGWLELCSLRLRSGRYEGALTAGQQALACAPDNPAAHARVGLALLYLERFGEAEQHLRRALELDPSMAPVHVNLGVSLERQGRLEEARASWAEALALDPSNGDARRRLEASAP